MRSIIGVLVLFLSCQICFSQVLTRKTVHGKVVNDSIAVESGLVFNVNAKTGAVIDSKGFFSILAKVNDSLVFTSLGFKTKRVVLSKSDIASSFYRVKLNAVANELLAVVVYATHGPHPEFANTQKIVDTQYFDDKQSSPANILMMPTGTGDPNNMDVIRVYKKIFKNILRNNPEKVDLVADASFTTVAMQNVGYSFFTDNLKIKEDEVGLFLLFCENDPKSASFSKINQQFEVMDFLINKNTEYKKIASLEK
jgi:hypothetical protein